MLPESRLNEAFGCGDETGLAMVWPPMKKTLSAPVLVTPGRLVLLKNVRRTAFVNPLFSTDDWVWFAEKLVIPWGVPPFPAPGRVASNRVMFVNVGVAAITSAFGIEKNEELTDDPPVLR